MPYLVECLASVEAQTIDPGRIEVIAVDDGSTDGTGEYLEEFAGRAPMTVTVVRQENSGGPSGPRNVGLARAAGRYVFFLDADDRLGPEALARMVALADRADPDVTQGMLEGVNRQENSGGPSGPRNVGLARAAGRYVFFLDADDRLGPEALERMVALADRAGTDVVLGRVEGVNRNAPKSMWRKTLERTDVHSS